MFNLFSIGTSSCYYRCFGSGSGSFSNKVSKKFFGLTLTKITFPNVAVHTVAVPVPRMLYYLPLLSTFIPFYHGNFKTETEETCDGKACIWFRIQMFALSKCWMQICNKLFPDLH
jgi:hypothetical protein